MLAIHNQATAVNIVNFVANAFAKLSKCQQFTTLVCSIVRICRLQTLLQSYQNVSNSQQEQRMLNALLGCKRFCKVIKMLAIHNISNNACLPCSVANAFAKLSKCQQFTTKIRCLYLKQVLQTLLQSYQNVSNSQRK